MLGLNNLKKLSNLPFFSPILQMHFQLKSFPINDTRELCLWSTS